MAHLEIENLAVQYGPVKALEGIDLAIASGEMFILLGGSGSGKTTLLRALGGFIPPTAGRITLGGQDITHLPPYKRPVNTTFQSYALFPHMTVADNVAFGLRRQRTPKPEIATRVAGLLRLLRLEPFAARKPDALSGGQRQRVALARALAPRPKLLLLDEPMSALDRNLREQTRQELLRVQRETGTTFVLVTHDQDEALAMATRIGLLHGGRLEQVGTPTEIYEHPRTRYVAAFMGAANILEATIQTPGPQAILQVPGIGPIQAQGEAQGRAGDPIHLALRPERLTLGGNHPNQAQGTIIETAYRGDIIDLTLRLQTGTTLHLSHPLANGATNLPTPGTQTQITWPREACILLQESPLPLGEGEGEGVTRHPHPIPPNP